MVVTTTQDRSFDPQAGSVARDNKIIVSRITISGIASNGTNIIMVYNFGGNLLARWYDTSYNYLRQLPGRIPTIQSGDITYDSAARSFYSVYGPAPNPRSPDDIPASNHGMRAVDLTNPPNTPNTCLLYTSPSPRDS